MTVGSPIDTDYSRRQLVVADDQGRLLMLNARGVYGDGKNDLGGSYNGGYPVEEESAYKTGTISADQTGLATSVAAGKLINSAANFPDWVVGCKVTNLATSKYAIVTAKDSVTQLSLGDQGHGVDIFPGAGDLYRLDAAASVTIGGATYSYLVDSSAAWKPDYGKGTVWNYLSLRGLWCCVESPTGVIQRKRILSNESNKLWFSTSWDTALAPGNTYYVGGIYFEFTTGYIYPQGGNSLSLSAMRQRVVSTNGTHFWVQLLGSGTDQQLDATAKTTKKIDQNLADDPVVSFIGNRNRLVQLKVYGVAMDDQLVWRELQALFSTHGR